MLLTDNGFDFFCGVPCSVLGRIIEYLSCNKDFQYVPATREDEALGIAVGAYMGGKKPVVLMQDARRSKAAFPINVNLLQSAAIAYASQQKIQQAALQTAQRFSLRARQPLL